MQSLEERNKNQRERRQRNGNAYTRKYEKTKSGFLVRLYRNMLSRVSGIQRAKYHLYAGCSLLPKMSFINGQIILKYSIYYFKYGKNQGMKEN